MEYVYLYNGNKVPSIGFGTYLIPKDKTIEAVTNAIKSGYRHIDTAEAYENEEEIGFAIAQCIAEGIVKREDLFITSKISPHKKIGYQEAIDALKTSLVKMDLDYIDCYLIHWPNVAPGAMWKELNAQTWRGFEKCYEEGLVKNIGVSNFMIHHLEELLKTAKIKPMVNQIHVSPIWQQKEVVAWCKEREIQIVAWSPLVRYQDWAGNFLNDQDYSKSDDFTSETMAELTSKYNKSKAQISLRWSIQKGYIPLAKSTNPERIKENLDIFNFQISDEDMKKLDELNSRPSNPDATPDSIYNSWAMGAALGKKEEIIKDKLMILGLPFLKWKKKNEKISKLYLFGVIPVIKIKKTIKNKQKYYLFGFLPTMNRIEKKDGVFKYYFAKIPFAKRTILKKTNINKDFLPNYQKEECKKNIKAPKWNPFNETLFNAYKYYADYMPEGKKGKLFKIYLMLRFLFTRKVYIPILTFRITSDCTLSCKECCAFTPYYKLNYMATFESFKSDLDNILRNVDQIQYLNLFGGEPLLNPNLAKMISYANTKKQIHKVFFTTNGTIIPSDEVLNAIKEKKENFIYMSDYRSNKNIDILKQDEIIEILKANNVPYFHIMHNFSSGWKIKPNNRENDINILKYRYYNCFEKNAKIVENGKYYCCTVARIVDATNQYELDNTHYIDLSSKKDLSKEFINIFSRDCFKVCEICDFTNAGYLRPTAIQIVNE